LTVKPVKSIALIPKLTQNKRDLRKEVRKKGKEREEKVEEEKINGLKKFATR
jgi:hypothetical protein